MLDVRRMKVLREVALTGSFSAAAESLAFTQPAISRQIATLEAEAGAQLVERSARGIRLTPAGELLVEHAETILDRLAAAEAQLEQLANLQGGTLRLGAPPTANATLIPLAIRRFDDEHPQVALRLDEGLSRDLIQSLVSGDIDLAVITDSEANVDVPEDVEVELLMDDPLHVALPHDHPLASKRDLTMADLREETWIEGRDRICAAPLISAAHAAGFEPRISFESAQWLGKQGLVAAGLGVSMIPTLALANVRDDIVLRSLGEDAPRRRVFTASLCCGYRNPAIEPMRRILREVAEEHCFSCDARVI